LTARRAFLTTYAHYNNTRDPGFVCPELENSWNPRAGVEGASYSHQVHVYRRYTASSNRLVGIADSAQAGTTPFASSCALAGQSIVAAEKPAHRHCNEGHGTGSFSASNGLVHYNPVTSPLETTPSCGHDHSPVRHYNYTRAHERELLGHNTTLLPWRNTQTTHIRNGSRERSQSGNIDHFPEMSRQGNPHRDSEHDPSSDTHYNDPHNSFLSNSPPNSARYNTSNTSSSMSHHNTQPTPRQRGNTQRSAIGVSNRGDPREWEPDEYGRYHPMYGHSTKSFRDMQYAERKLTRRVNVGGRDSRAESKPREPRRRPEHQRPKERTGMELAWAKATGKVTDDGDARGGKTNGDEHVEKKSAEKKKDTTADSQTPADDADNIGQEGSGEPVEAPAEELKVVLAKKETMPPKTETKPPAATPAKDTTTTAVKPADTTKTPTNDTKNADVAKTEEPATPAADSASEPQDADENAEDTTSTTSVPAPKTEIPKTDNPKIENPKTEEKADEAAQAVSPTADAEKEDATDAAATPVPDEAGEMTPATDATQATETTQGEDAPEQEVTSDNVATSGAVSPKPEAVSPQPDAVSPLPQPDDVTEDATATNAEVDATGTTDANEVNDGE